MWIASAPSGMVQKYTHDGSLLQIGTKGKLTLRRHAKGKPLNSLAATFFYAVQHLADWPMATSTCRTAKARAPTAAWPSWTARASSATGSSTIWRTHCMTIANEGMVYVCNRQGSRFAYDKMGKLQGDCGAVDAGDAAHGWRGEARGQRLPSTSPIRRSG